MSGSDAEAHGGASPPLTGALGLWTWDLAGARVRGDARFAALLNLPPDEALRGVSAETVFGRAHPEDRLRLKIAVAGVAQGAEVFARDFRVLSGEGVRWVSARGRAEHRPDRRPRAFTGVLTDVTEQKRAEERLRIAQSAGGVGTFEFVEGFGTVDVSDQFCRLLGLRVAESLPVHTINALVDPEDPPLIGGPHERPASFRSEVRIRRADDGELRWLAVQGERRLGPNSEGLTTIGAVYDITAAKAAEARLQELARALEQRVEARTQERDRLWNASRDLFGVVGADGVYRAVNPAWRRILGWNEADVVGRSFQEFVQPDDLAAAASKWEARGGGAVALEDFDARMRAKDGGWRWVNWTVIPEGEAFYAVGRDVTERKQLEQQLRQSQKMEAVGQLTGGIAHDFNNMLTGILGGLDMVQRRIAKGRVADADRFIVGAIASAERAAALTHRLLAFSRQQTLDPKSVDANGLVGSMEDLLRRTLGERVDLAIRLDPGLWRTAVDANQLESALLNLAINARDAMPDGGRLTVETANESLAAPVGELPAGDYVRLSVGDTGTGMSPEVVARVFDPFFTTKPLGQGTGLGLSMVFGFARQSGGDVVIDSEPGRGTAVRLYLPRHEGPEAVAQRPQAAEAPVGAGEAVLVVEDDPAVRPVVVELLRELGYAPVEASEAEAALEVLGSSRPLHLMISDVGLPGLDGRQLAERARELRPALPVLLITGYAGEAGRRADFLGPGMEMIAKPFATDALARRIRAMIPR